MISTDFIRNFTFLGLDLVLVHSWNMLLSGQDEMESFSRINIYGTWDIASQDDLRFILNWMDEFPQCKDSEFFLIVLT